MVRDDGGYVGALADGSLVTSQVSGLRSATIEGDQLAAVVTFCRMPQNLPTPALFLLLRLLNLTLMRSIAVGNLVKRAMVRRLIGSSPGLLVCFYNVHRLLITAVMLAAKFSEVSGRRRNSCVTSLVLPLAREAATSRCRSLPDARSCIRA